MANPDHLKWLKEGVEAWNARCKRDPSFHPDLSKADLSGVDLGSVNFAEANLQAARLEGSNLTDANFAWAYLQDASLVRADLSKANLTEAFLKGANFYAAILDGVDARSFEFGERGNNLFNGNKRDSEPEYTVSFSNAHNLSQDQLNSMLGDKWTKIPDHLERPAHWLQDGVWEGHPEPDDDELDDPVVEASNASLRERLVINRTALPLAAQTVLIEVDALKERLARAHNQMDEDARREMDAALDRLASHTETLGTAVPQEADLSDAVVEKVDAARKGFAASFKETMDKLLLRERLGEVGAPIALVCGCVTLGAIVGVSAATMLAATPAPILLASGLGTGSGVGLVIGKMLTAESKGGAGLKEAKDHIPTDEPET